jgi:hypothetical protein
LRCIGEASHRDDNHACGFGLRSLPLYKPREFLDRKSCLSNDAAERARFQISIAMNGNCYGSGWIFQMDEDVVAAYDPIDNKACA